MCTHPEHDDRVKVALHDDVVNWRHFPRYWPFVRGIHRSPMNSPHKGQWRGTLMFSLICAWINRWVNNGEVGNLRRYHAHCDVIVMLKPIDLVQRNTILRISGLKYWGMSPINHCWLYSLDTCHLVKCLQFIERSSRSVEDIYERLIFKLLQWFDFKIDRQDDSPGNDRQDGLPYCEGNVLDSYRRML